jgi:glycosyltransferase involved in cell wall biosynthesis
MRPDGDIMSDQAPLRILITADPYIPVPPTLYGGIERVVALLARGLVARGHHVTLVAHPASLIDGVSLVPYGSPPHDRPSDRARELLQLNRATAAAPGAFDLVHSFGRLAGLLAVLPRRGLPKVQSYQRAVDWPGIARAVRLAGRSLEFTACSTSLYRGGERLGARAGTWHTIFNGVELDRYQPVFDLPYDAPVVFLGRLEPEKGAHVAIDVARRANVPLVIAGNRVDAHAGYFEQAIAPHLTNGLVRYVGPVDDSAKNALLGRARAVLFPSLFEEPFGIVMAEAMACGTPVVALARGSVPEVVRDGVNGVVCQTEDDLIAGLEQARGIDRGAVRRDCEARFASDVIVAQYEALYEGLRGSVRGSGAHAGSRS